MSKIASADSKLYGLGGAFHFTFAIFLAILSTKLAHKLVAPDVIFIPWGVISILLLPTTYNVNLLIKLSETKKNTIEDISRSEARALDVIVSRKKLNAMTMLILQLLIVATNIMLSLGRLTDFLPICSSWILSSVIGLTVMSLYLIVPSILGIKEINEFEAKVKERKSQSKKIKAALDKLK